MYAQAVQTTFGDAVDTLSRSAPTLMAFGGLLLAGWLSARLLSAWSRRLVGAVLARMSRAPMVGEALDGTGAGATVPKVVGAFVFWVVLLVFVAAAIDTLGIPAITDSLSQLAYYLPNLFAAVVIVLVGVIAGALARGAAVRSAAASGVARGDAVGRAVQSGVVSIAVVMALEQVGVSGQLLVVLVATVVGTMFAGAALAFGLGARTAVGNIVASYYVAQSYQPGQRVRIGDAEGQIIRTTPTAVILDTREGQLTIPAHRFAEQPSVLLAEA